METWAAVRKTSSHRYLKDKRINFIELDFSSKEKLKEQLQGHDFDYVVHAAGATKCLHKEDFFRINTEGTKNFVSAIRELQMPLKRFVYVSSLSIYGAIREEQPYTEIKESDTPKPNTAYGESKLAAERYLDEQNEGLSEEDKFPFVVLRPTGVYGPRENDYIRRVESSAGHTYCAGRSLHEDLTF